MKRVIAWTGVALVGAAAVVIGALLIIPLAVDLDPYRTALEKSLTDVSGRAARVGNLRLSLFPWVGVSLQGLSLANPAGFAEPDLLKVPFAELRMKLLPLLRREVQVDRVVLDDPRLVLETAADGRSNWEADAAARGQRSSRAPGLPTPPAVSPAAALFVSDLSLENGSVTVTDDRTGSRHEFTGIRVQVQDASFDRPVRLKMAAAANGWPVSGEGVIGPIGPTLGGGAVPFELSLTALGEMKVRLSGTIRNVLVGPLADLTVTADEFSPRRLTAAFGHPLPPTVDPRSWQRASLQATAQIGVHGLSVTDGVLHLDDSRAEVRLNAPDWGRRGVSFDLHVDRFDLDRYLQSAGRNPPPAGPDATPEGSRDARPANPGRRLPPVPALNGTVAIDRLTCMHARLEQVSLRLAGSEGMLTIDPVAAMLYEGSTSGRVEVDLRSDSPLTSIRATLEGVQVGPLLKDLNGNEALEGRAQAGLSLSMAGDQPAGMLRTLAGNGRLNVTDGAVVGLDLLGVARGSKGNNEGGRPHTAFSELTLLFTIEDGIVNITDGAAVSPPLHLTAAGKIDLVQETLNLRVGPRMAGEAGVGMVIAGRFSSPEIRPDLDGVARKALKKALGGDADDASRKAGDLLKGLLPKKKP